MEFPDQSSTRRINPDKFDNLEKLLKSTVRYEFPAERLKFLEFMHADVFSVFGKKL